MKSAIVLSSLRAAWNSTSEETSFFSRATRRLLVSSSIVGRWIRISCKKVRHDLLKSIETNAYRFKTVEYISVPASNLENWASLRNMLTRIYEKIDDRFLHEIVKRDLGNFSAFIKVVEKLGEK
jgi:hypothetical protein